MSSIRDNLKIIEDNIHSACDKVSRQRENVKLVVVSKTATIEQIQEVIKLGYTDFGENRLQHLKPAYEQVSQFLLDNVDNPDIPKRVKWHMIGHMQRNKVKQTLQMVSTIQAVDTLRLAEEIDKISEKLTIKPKIYLQVNCSGEPQKYGVPVGAAVHLAEQICTMPNLQLIGFMTMGPLTDDKNVISKCFSRAKELFDDIAKEEFLENKFTELSMGMSNDYELAIEHGATNIRIGSAIFRT